MSLSFSEVAEWAGLFVQLGEFGQDGGGVVVLGEEGGVVGQQDGGGGRTQV